MNYSSPQVASHRLPLQNTFVAYAGISLLIFTSRYQLQPSRYSSSSNPIFLFTNVHFIDVLVHLTPQHIFCQPL